MGGCCSVDKAGELSSQDLDLALGNGPQGVLSGRSSSRTKGAVANFAPSSKLIAPLTLVVYVVVGMSTVYPARSIT
eukprot:m.33639 g.33639  ORF g.33639 m.33639 type:complete len:76 (+) comp12249_c0_seq2:103-330(+)